MSNQLQQRPSAELIALENRMARGAVDMVESAKQIRDRKLYLQRGYQTWRDYCEQYLNKSQSTLWRMIKAAEIAAEVPQRLIPSRAVALELSKVPPERRQEVATAAFDGGDEEVTAETVRRLIGPIKDETGMEVPPELIDLWLRNHEVQIMLTSVSRLKSKLEEAKEKNDPLYREIMFTDTLAKLTMVYEEIKSAKPYAVCPDCNGVNPKGCETCKERGILSKFRWGMLPEEKRNL